jgi:hypothetical protein
MVNFYQLFLTTDFQIFEISQIWVEILTPNFRQIYKNHHLLTLAKFGTEISTQFWDIKIYKWKLLVKFDAIFRIAYFGLHNLIQHCKCSKENAWCVPKKINSTIHWNLKCTSTKSYNTQNILSLSLKQI